MHLPTNHHPSHHHSIPRVLSFFVLTFFSPVHSWKAQWCSREPAHTILPRRSGHVAFSIDSGPFVFGGYVEDDDNQQRYYVTNDLWKWNDDQWHQVETVGGDIPRARLLATASVLNNKCYLMGGWDPETEGTGGVILDTVHCFEAGTWSCLPVTMPDGPTSRHVAVALSDHILVHTHRCQDYVLLFDPQTQSFRRQDTTGSCPSPRGLHAATRLNQHQVLFFGGAAQAGTMSEDAFVLDTKTWEWTLLPKAKGPTARAGVCLTRVDDHTALLFGGAQTTSAGLRPRGDVWLLDTHKDRWELLLGDDDEEENGAERPPPRNAATLSLLEGGSDDTKTFLLTGGWHPFVKTYNDCFILKLTKS